MLMMVSFPLLLRIQNVKLIPPSNVTQVGLRNYLSEDTQINIKSADGRAFTLKAAFVFITESSMKPNIFYKLTTDAEMNPIHPKLLCGRSTFFRRFASFQKTKLIPEDHDYGIAVGAPQTLHDGNLRMLNEDLKNTVGFSEGGDVLSENIVTIKEESLASRGHHVPVKVPCTETAKFYQLVRVRFKI